MSTPSQKGNNNQETTLTLEQQVERLKKVGYLAYSINGYAPSETGWKLEEGQIRDIVKNLTRAYLEDVSKVTLDFNKNSGAIYAYVWIPRNSRHLCDNSLNSNESAIKRTRMAFSSQLKEFMNKFCEHNDHRVYGNEQNLPLTGIKVRLDPYMQMEFDEKNITYGKIYGSKYLPKTKITLTPVYHPSKKGETFGPFRHLLVVKSHKSTGNFADPKPTRSYNAR